MNFKYNFDTSSKKFQCPKCHHKTFVCYIDSETQQYLDPQFGKCDRSEKCSYQCFPKGNVKISDPYVIPLILEPDYHDFSLVENSMKDINSNNFVRSLLNAGFTACEIQPAMNSYYIGKADRWKGDTVFWQVDEKMRVHSGKVMLYDEFTGKRVKSPYNHITWMHSVLQKANPVLHGKTFHLKQCLFGLQTVIDVDSFGKTIAIVESEKTAVVMSIMRPDMLWMATGSKSNFKDELLRPLKGRNIMAFPDRSEFNDWDMKSTQMRSQGLNIICSNFLERQDLEDGADLADLYLPTGIAA